MGRDIESRLKDTVNEMDVQPRLGILTAGEVEGTWIYMRQIIGAARRLGAEVVEFNAEAGTDDALDRLAAAVHETDAVLIGHPLPEGLDFQVLVNALPPEADVEGLNPYNLGLIISGEPSVLPPTPAAVMELVERNDIDLRGAEAVIVNHSPILGRPLSVLFQREDATVTVCHVFTGDLVSHTQNADVLVVGAGVPGLITGDMVKKGALVIDVGINRVDGKICGDVEIEDVLNVASAVTPVPGGVGPVTVAMLMKNLVHLSSSM